MNDRITWPPEAQTPLDVELKNFVNAIQFIVWSHRAEGVSNDTVYRQVIEDAESAIFVRDVGELITTITDPESEYYGGVGTPPAVFYRLALNDDGFFRHDERAVERVVCLAGRVAAAALARPFGKP